MIRIGRPVITGDSATVWLYAYHGAYGAEVDEQFLLKRMDFVWVIMRKLQTRESLFAKPPEHTDGRVALPTGGPA